MFKKKAPVSTIDMKSVEVVRASLERAEQKMLESIGGDLALHALEPGFDRDRFNYLLGTVSAHREMLMCLGVSPLDMKTKVTVELEKKLGYR